MGSKRKVIVCVCTVLLLISAIVIIRCTILKENTSYGDKLLLIMREQEESTVSDIFSFEFDKAYIFNDSYISGEGLAKRYNLNISIDEVKSGVSENIQRIVFVNKKGDFVYEFKCDTSEVILLEKGAVIYPNTVIKRKSTLQESILTISFQSVDYYDSQKQ